MLHKTIADNKTIITLRKNISAYNPVWENIFKSGLSQEESGICQQILDKETPIIDLAFEILLDQNDIIALFSEIQKSIKNIIGKHHYYTPIDCYHITVYGHAYAGSTPAEYRNCVATPATINNLLPEYIQSAQNISTAVIKKTMAIPLTYKYILISRDSIIAIADDGDRLNDLRRQIIMYGNTQGFYDQRDPKNLYPNIAHTTLVRFTEPVKRSQIKKIYLKFNKPLNTNILADTLQFRRFYQYGLWPNDDPIEIIKLLK